jgi:hypothetical protein
MGTSTSARGAVNATWAVVAAAAALAVAIILGVVLTANTTAEQSAQIL